MIDFIDLFSGIGGFRLGLERAGQVCKHSELWPGDKERRTFQYPESRGSGERGTSIGYRHIWSNDFNKYANQIYTKNFGEKGHNSTDITGIDPEEIPDFDLICAGFPCQSFSVAGKRKGFKETRGTLFFDICRIAEAKRPSLLLLENVKGLLNHDGGRTFTIILQSLDELGYWVEWQVLNSKYFGVPQNRERVFIIGHLRGTSSREIFPLTKSNRLSEEGKRERKTKNQLSTAITQNLKRGVHSGGETLIVEPSLKKIGNIYDTGHDSVGGRVYDPEGIAMNLNAEGGGLGAKTGLYSIQTPKIANTLDPDGYFRFGQRINGELLPISHRRIRRLTPVECERLQGFPDGWTEGVSDTQRYRTLGNAVTVNVIEFLGKRILSSFTNKDAV